ncbi:MAG: IS1380 family transposase, partial [Desulfobulbus sp.]|nr:IS1380 family transposase [Desulfobulbus sp.]
MISYVKWNPRKNDPIAWRDNVFAQGEVQTPRKGKRVCTVIVEEQKEVQGTTYSLKRIVRVTERTIDKTGQFLLTPDITLEGWWT